jgi:hypothetical protein
MDPVKVVLVEWMGYPLFREKRLGPRSFRCGLGNLVRNIQRYDAGVAFECTVVVNQSPERYAWVNHVPGLGRMLLNRPQTNSRLKYERFLRSYACVAQTVYRDNSLQDIGAYDYFYRQLKRDGHTGHVLFANSSVRGPHENGWLLKYKELFEREVDTGFCGISLNSQNTKNPSRPFLPHAQSFFLYTSMPVLERVFPDGLVATTPDGNVDRVGLIESGEIGMSQKVLAAGYGLRCSMFPDFFYKSGMEWTIPEGDLRFKKAYFDQANLC